MKSIYSLIVFSCGVAFSNTSSAEPVASPDGRVVVDVTVDGGNLTYQISLADKPLLKPSPLGLVTSAADLSTGLHLVDESAIETVDESYNLPNGKKSSAEYHAHRRTYTVANGDGVKLSVIVQVSDDGVALAYRLHGGADEQVTVERELTGFAFNAAAHSFLHPMHVARSGWSRTNPSYEAHYEIDKPVGESSPDGVGWCFPALFHVPEVGWALLSETGVDGNYCGTHLAHESTGGVYRLAFPQKLENLPTDPIAPTVAGNGETPWRIIYVGESLAPIVESTLATDLVEPKFEYEPLPTFGASAWSWVFLKDGETVYDVQRDFIDMAARVGLEYVLIDSMWDQQIGREKVAELVDYAKAKGVGILLWYNSNGPWNDAPQTPKDRMYEPAAREEEMAWLEKIGVKGIKVDFFGGDKQHGMQFYDDLFRDAARHHLAINYHGTTLPRGWERMYPNFVTCEAVMGMEFCTFDQRNADLQPQHCTVLPFVRNVVGPMDFTPVILSRRLSPNNRGQRRRTTDAFELALPVVFQSGIQHLGVTPDQLAEQPEEVCQYLGSVPTVWDETKLLDGYPGKFVVIARRSGNTWYVAGINGEHEPREISPALDFAGDSLSWTVLADGTEGVEVKHEWATEKLLHLTLPANGGVVAKQDVIEVF